MDNKVAVTLARTFVNLGYVVARINFRGVGASEGVHDHGHGETDDMAVLHRLDDGQVSGPAGGAGRLLVRHLRAVAAGAAPGRGRHAGRALGAGGRRRQESGTWPAIPADTILIHGENDDTIPLIDVLDWLRPQDIAVIVIPGADHFFHRKLQHIKRLGHAAVAPPAPMLPRRKRTAQAPTDAL